jgi:hypothetical protein
LEVEAQFVAQARAAGAPEKRFRFATACVEERCAQWTGTRCGVIDLVLEHHDQVPLTPDRRPACAIRSSCRWFAQSGWDACAVCPSVVTDCT